MPRVCRRGSAGIVEAVCAAVALFGTLALGGCGVGSAGPPHRDWLYTVPRGYMGFLAIRYACPGGSPLRITREVASVTFSLDGVACVKDAYLPSVGTVAAQDAAGRFIPVRNTIASLRPPGDERGYALFDERSGERNGYTYTLAWVGETQVYDGYRRTDAFTRDREAFLSAHLDERRATASP